MEITLLYNSHLIKCNLQKNNSLYIVTIQGDSAPHNLLIEKWDKKNSRLYFCDTTTKIRYKAQLINNDGIISGIVWNTKTPHPSTSSFAHETTPAFFAAVPSATITSHNVSLLAPLTGRIVTLFKKVGETVDQGTPLVVIESMKMENEIRSERNGIIKTILIAPGDVVETNQPLILFEEPLDEGKEDEKKQVENR